MLKTRKLIALIALLLIGATLLTACKDPGDGETPPMDPSGMVFTYAETVEKWATYVSYNAEAPTQTEFTATTLLSGLEETTVFGDLILTAKAEEIFESRASVVEGDPPVSVQTETVVTYKIYTTAGKLLYTFVSREPVLTAGKVDETIALDEIVTYSFDLDEQHGLILVCATKYELKETEPEAEPLDPTALASYDASTTYTYYMEDGTELFKDLKSPVSYRAVNSSRYLLDCKEKDTTYLMLDGKPIHTFGYQMDYAIPEYDEDSLNLGGTGYAYFEKNGNKYLIVESAPVTMPLGDLYLVLVPGIDIQVTDAENNPLVSYTGECYGISGYAVLSNGNIYICEYELLNKDATEYDVKSGEDKLNINHKIINVTNGSVTTLDLAYKTGKLFNNVTPMIKTYLNLTTMEVTDANDLSSALLNSVSVKAGYILAEIQKYENGLLNSETTYAVLDENLAIVAELPKIVANQFAYPGYMDKDTMIVSTRTVNNKNIYYAIELASGKASLLPELRTLSRIEPVNNGYVWYTNNSCKLYDKDWKLMRDFETAYSSESYHEDMFRIINGDLYCRYYYDGSNSGAPEYYTVMKYAITKSEGSNYSMTSYEIASNVKFYGETALLVFEDYEGDQLFRTLNSSDVLFGEETRVDTTIFSKELQADVSYSKNTTIQQIVALEQGYLVCFETAYEKRDYIHDPTDIPTSFVEYTYTVIK